MEQMASFGYWVRRRRKALDLTQAELAQRVACAVVTIQKIEEQVRRPSKAFAARLAAALELPPAEHATFLKVARAEQAVDRLSPTLAVPHPTASVTGVTALPHALPTPATTLIGRADEVAAVTLLLKRPDVRLVTLTGTGGTGKTRLALQVAADLHDAFADGVAFVELAAVTAPDLVPGTIMQLLDIAAVPGPDVVDQLILHLRQRHLLLVVDNFEHLLPAAPLMAKLLRAAPRLKVLVTSRAVLHLQGEHEYLVPPLAVPAAALRELDTAAASAAIRLFVARAQAVNAAFQLTRDNVAAVADICRHLEGLPLAIELAAARTKLFAPVLLRQRLAHRLRELTGGPRDAPDRQRTLRATIDWSHQLLDPNEQQLLRQVAVFVGGWTLDAAEVVCNSPAARWGAVVDGIQSLLNTNLLQQEAVGGTIRFTMLEVIREYALEQLVAHDELDHQRQRHAQYYLQVGLDAEPNLGGPERSAWLAQLEHDQHNLSAALAWLAKRGAMAAVLQLAAALEQFWLEHHQWREGRRWLELALTASAAHGEPPLRAYDGSPEVPAVPALVRAEALRAAGALAEQQRDLVQANRWLGESVTLCRASGDTHHLARALYQHGRIAWLMGEHARAVTLHEESLALYRHRGDTSGMATQLFSLGIVAESLGDSRRATARYAESLALARQVGDTETAASIWLSLGHLAQQTGDDGQAEQCYGESLALYRELGNRWYSALVLLHLSEVVQRQGDARRAGALRSESGGLFRDEVRRHRWSDETIAGVLATFAALASGAGQAERAARLFGAADARRAAESDAWAPNERAWLARMIAAARRQVDDAAWAAAWARGRALPLEQAIDNALDEEPMAAQPRNWRTEDADRAPETAGARAAGLARLTGREGEVLRLVAQGLRSSEVAAELGLSPLTVNVHLRAIYRKLGVRSRTAATRVAIEQQLV